MVHIRKVIVMGSTMWCRNCSKSRNHIGMEGNFWKEKESGDLAYRCTRCGHIRTRNDPELSKGTVLEIDIPGDNSEKILSQDGFLKEQDNHD